MSDHDHDHEHDHEHAGDEAADLTVPDSELSPDAYGRREFLRRAGVIGAAAATAASVFGPLSAAAAERIDAGRPPIAPDQPSADDREDAGDAALRKVEWLAGDHHIHTQFSPDAQYRVIQQVGHAAIYGLDWMVITDHGGVDHQRLGVDLTYPRILDARNAYPGMLVFQGFEWNIPSAEHGTVFVAPGPVEKDLLKAFEGSYDGVVNNATKSSPQNEALALAGINWLGQQVAAGRTSAALFLANHPARKGLDSPHEIRAWRDTNPRIAVGMEGAPGHQAAGIASPNGPGSGRGYYDNAPTVDSFPAYPLESYRTFGGFDWMTATVGGLWDSLLAEGTGWWITANSDSHKVYRDAFTNPPGAVYANGQWPDPVDSGVAQLGYGDFWPGFYSRTHVGARSRSYLAVMEAIRKGRVWVGHGHLIRSLDVVVQSEGNAAASFGGRVVVRRGRSVRVRMRIGLNDGINANGDSPRLRRVDLITGPVTGPVDDRDTFTAPGASVVRSFDVNQAAGELVFDHVFPQVDQPFYLRLRGTDGNVTGAATAADPAPPRLDPLGDANPWRDLWFYSNPVFVLTQGR